MDFHVSDTPPHSKALQLLEVLGIFWQNVSFACSAIMLHARYFIVLLPEQHSGLDAYLLYLIHQSQFLRSSETGLTVIWETCSTPCFCMDYSPRQETFPWLPPRHAQFAVPHWECETWPLLPPCGWQFDHSTWGWQGILPAWTSLTTAGGPEHPSVLGPSSAGHGEIFARPCIAWASKLIRPWWVFPAARQALEDAWLTGSWDVSDPPIALHHLEAALHSLLTTHFSPWFP